MHLTLKTMNHGDSNDVNHLIGNSMGTWKNMREEFRIWFCFEDIQKKVRTDAERISIECIPSCKINICVRNTCSVAALVETKKFSKWQVWKIKIFNVYSSYSSVGQKMRHYTLHTFIFIRTSNFIWGSSVLRILRSQHDINKAFVLKNDTISTISAISALYKYS